jgi:choline kinase
MKAIILAAGLGSRLSRQNSELPKCLLELHGKSILLHQLDLLAACGIIDITIVTGFAAEHIRRAAGDRAKCVYYPHFASTNNLLTLHYHRRLLSGSLLLLFSDVLLACESLKDCVNARADFALLVDTSRCVEGTMRVRLDGGAVTDLGSHIATENGDGNFIGISRCSATGASLLAEELNDAVSETDCRTAYYTQALARLAAKRHRLEAVDLKGRPWVEVDTASDYLIAQNNRFYASPQPRS